MLAGEKHSVVFHARRDDVAARINQARDGEIVGLSAAAGEDNLGGAATKQRCHRVASVLDRGPRLLSVMMNRRRVAELLREIRPHRLKHFGQYGRGGVVVEINAAHIEPSPILPCTRLHTPVETLLTTFLRTAI